MFSCVFTVVEQLLIAQANVSLQWISAFGSGEK